MAEDRGRAYWRRNLLYLAIGISPEGIGALGMVLNFAVAMAVSRFTAPPPAEVRELVEDIRIPRGAPLGHELSG